MQNNVNTTDTTATWYVYSPQYIPVKRTTRTIERYDAEGKYIGKKVITEEIEEYYKPIYPINAPTVYPPWDGTYGNYFVQGNTTNSYSTN